MEDITSKITEILNNPDIMDRIKDLANGIKPQEKKEELEEKNSEIPENQELSPDILSAVMKIAPLLSSIENDDKYANFLKSLRPLLSESRQKKLDESSKLIKIFKILPILKNSGIIWGIRWTDTHHRKLGKCTGKP